MKFLDLIFIFLLIWLNFDLCLAQSPQIWLDDKRENRTFGSVEVQNLSPEQLETLQKKALSLADWQKLFWVKTIPASQEKSPVLGSYIFDNQVIRFIPRFAFVDDLEYMASFDLNFFNQLIEQKQPSVLSLQLRFWLPKLNDQTPPEVVGIYPNLAEIPENQLKLYIEFSRPMQKGKIWQYIHFFNENEQEIQPFLILANELWNVEQTRLTLWFDPGRIKRGLRPHQEMGAPLELGKTYTLKISSQWTDNQGVALKGEAQKKYKIIQADRVQPNPQNWQIKCPKSLTNNALQINFGESLDYALSQKLIHILDQQGNVLEGQISVNEAVNQWGFVPQSQWKSGQYTLRIQTRLEDLAGNSLRRLFDLADAQNNENQLSAEFLDIDFKVL
jgi:hypothetical protein